MNSNIEQTEQDEIRSYYETIKITGSRQLVRRKINKEIVYKAKNIPVFSFFFFLIVTIKCAFNVLFSVVLYCIENLR